jgi:hypothetical protein
MNEQLEFDLVSPYLAGPDRHEQRLLDEAAALLGMADDKLRVARIAAELRHEDAVTAATPGNELAEMKVLLGPVTWKKTRRLWERRLKQNVRAFRKVLIVLKHGLTD